jgi:hypothetical protein
MRSFDHEFKRTEKIIKIWFITILVFVIIMAVMISSIIGYVFYSVASGDLNSQSLGNEIGQFIGAIEQGMNQGEAE